MQASTHRKLPICMRPDLEVVKQYVAGQCVYTVGDPLSIEYQRLNPQEFALLQWLDGQRSAQEIKQLFEREFAPCQIEFREIENYASQFHQQGLVESLTGATGHVLLARARKKRFTKRIGKLKNLLSIRFRGVNPDAWLRWLTPRTAWFFSVPMICLNGCILLAALILVTMNFQAFQERLPQFQEFFSPRNWLAVGLVLLVTKTLHELGHGIVYTKYGGKCHELGVMVMVFMPTLYVNTSGAWKLSDKWQRAAIAAAGMYVELFLAAIATFVWWYARPGVVQYTALNVMVTCSFSALLFNANPLMKYDGYFIFSDLMELPNLQQRAAAMVRSVFLKIGLGIDDPVETQSTDVTRRWLLAYGVASYLYRFVVIYGIAFVLASYFRGVGLEWLAKGLSGASWLALLAMPGMSLWKYFRQPGNWQRLRGWRPWGSVGGVGLAAAGFFLIPLPASVTCPFVVEPHGVHTIYVQQDCVLDRLCVAPGEWVDAGQVLVEQRDLDLELQIAAVDGELSGYRRQWELLRQLTRPTPAEHRERSELQTRIASLEDSLQELERRRDLLTLRATRDGFVLPHWVEPAPAKALELESFSGWTLVAYEGPRFLRRGEILCRIGDTTQLQAKLSVDQSDIRQVAEGRAVRLQLDSHRSAVLRGAVESVTVENVTGVDASLTIPYGGSIEASSPAQGAATEASMVTPNSATYAAVVPLRGLSLPTTIGTRGIAKIDIGYRTPFQHLWHTIHKLFRFDL